MRFSHFVIYKLFFDTHTHTKNPQKNPKHHHLKGKKIPNLKVSEWDTKTVTVQWNKGKSRWLEIKGDSRALLEIIVFPGFYLPGLFLAHFGLLCDREKSKANGVNRSQEQVLVTSWL